VWHLPKWLDEATSSSQKGPNGKTHQTLGSLQGFRC